MFEYCLTHGRYVLIKLFKGLRDVFIKVHQKYGLPVGDFPDINKFRETLKAQDFSKFAKLNPKMIDSMDQVIIFI